MATLMLAIAFALCGSIQPTGAQGPVQQSKATKVQVAFLYKFSLYIAWPQNAFAGQDAPFEIGVLGAPAAGDWLDRIAKSKKVGGRRIVVHRFNAVQDVQQCHMLYLSGSNSAKVHQDVIEKTKDWPVLLVGEQGGFAQNGASVNFYVDNNGTLGLKINIDTLRRKNLQANAKLLQIANVVRDAQAKLPNQGGRR